jgi:hypothetical protein
MSQAAMGLESEPGTGMGIGCGQQASIPADRVDDKIRRQINLLLEVPEQMAGWPRLTLGARRQGANRKDLLFAQIPHNLQASVFPLTSAKEQFVVTGTLGAINATPCSGYKLRVPLVEGGQFQEQQNVVLYPLLQVPNGEQNALGLGSGSVPLFAEAIGECLLPLRRLQFGEQQGVAYADLLRVERLDHWRGKHSQSDSGSTVRGRFSHLGRDLLDAVFRVFQVEQSF